tara:strand:+ start:1095 stop:1730 length:636 start_codon:yes stop_codon:yes gene_type:complete
MDKLDTLILDDIGIKYIHEYYKKLRKERKEIPKMKSLVCISLIHCDYCSSRSRHPDNYASIQERLNYGVQICNKCLANHNHHISFLRRSLKHNTLSWWQFIRLNYSNKFIKELCPLKSIGCGFGNDKEPPFDELYIDVTRVIKIKKNDTMVTDVYFPVYFKFTKEYPNFFPNNSKRLSLEEFCKLNTELDMKQILENITNYLFLSNHADDL